MWGAALEFVTDCELYTNTNKKTDHFISQCSVKKYNQYTSNNKLWQIRLSE